MSALAGQPPDTTFWYHAAYVAAIVIYGAPLRGIAPALVGGFDSVAGTVPGAVIVALVEVLGVRYLGGGSNDAVVFTVLLLFVMVRPRGLFGGVEARRV